MTRWLSVALCALAIIMLEACGAAEPPVSSSTLNVVSTVAPVVNIVFNIGGRRIRLVGIIPEGSDSHTFEPAPSDALRLSRADLLFFNGLDLETPTLKLAQANRKAGAEIILLGEQTIKPDQYVFDFSFPKEQGHPNPHVWMNPLYALRYAQLVKDALSRRDAPNAAYYQANYDRYQARISVLDAAIMKAVQSVPETQRKLLTYHDSFAYFAARYPVTVLGAIQPASFSEPSAKEVAALIEQVRAEKVPAIFGSEVFPSKVLEQIGHESGARYVDTLRDDELPGKRGDPVHSYIGMMAENVKTMVGALGGDPKPMEAIDPSNIPGPDSAVDQTK
ncbi:MAG: zinc ABC transporter substrate-binding protein [Chloroflexi bacterium]|nr:zinc ABC transporter substrate-binding protein [Chloroflexota bacterium]